MSLIPTECLEIPCWSVSVKGVAITNCSLLFSMFGQNSKFKRPDPPKNNRIGISWYYPHLQLCPKINTYKVSRNSLQTFKKNCVYQPRPTPPPPQKKQHQLTDWLTGGRGVKKIIPLAILLRRVKIEFLTLQSNR